jgi:hypothetical protein
VRIFYVDEASPAAFGTSNLPSSKVRAPVGRIRLSGKSITAGQVLTVPINLSLISKNCTQVSESGAFNGFLNFTLESNSQIRFQDLTDASGKPTLTISQNAVTWSERYSVANRQMGERWRIDPRDGFPHPVSEFSEDGERKGLYTTDPDEVGKRETRNKGRREKEARLWPRI